MEIRVLPKMKAMVMTEDRQNERLEAMKQNFVQRLYVKLVFVRIVLPCLILNPMVVQIPLKASVSFPAASVMLVAVRMVRILGKSGVEMTKRRLIGKENIM